MPREISDSYITGKKSEKNRLGTSCVDDPPNIDDYHRFPLLSGNHAGAGYDYEDDFSDIDDDTDFDSEDEEEDISVPVGVMPSGMTLAHWIACCPSN